jgi:hypothetical protein
MALAGKERGDARDCAHLEPTLPRKIGEASLKRVANREKMMPRNFISPNGFSITARCRRYLEPLIRGEDYPAYDKMVYRVTSG